MLSNKAVVENFAVGKNSHNRNLESRGTRLINYSTCLAQFYGGKLLINTTKYSVSTSKVQNLLYAHFLGHKDVQFINNVRIGTLYLDRFV